jgi:hypothetical protein
MSFGNAQPMAISSGGVPARDWGWSLVAAVNDERVLNKTLLASPAIGTSCEVILRRGYASAGKAYNSALKAAYNDIVVFAHQDVFLPATWPLHLQRVLDALETAGTPWGVLGCFGIRRERPPRPYGYCYSTGLRTILGEPFNALVPAHTLDELLLVVRRSSGLCFDEQLHGFHLYGADLCLTAAAHGLENFIIPAFCIHNAKGVVRLPLDFWRAYFYLRRKWRRALPVTTCCTVITTTGFPVLHRLAVEWKERVLSRDVGGRSEDVVQLYQDLSLANPQVREGLRN